MNAMGEVNSVVRIIISTEGDILTVRKEVRNQALELGFGATDVTRIVTAASELARNVFRFAGKGEMRSRLIQENARQGVEIVFEDNGPGIPDLDQAMEPGFTTGGGLGLGLPGAKRLMDEMEVDSKPHYGTRVMVRKWRH